MIRLSEASKRHERLYKNLRPLLGGRAPTASVSQRMRERLWTLPELSRHSIAASGYQFMEGPGPQVLAMQTSLEVEPGASRRSLPSSRVFWRLRTLVERQILAIP